MGMMILASTRKYNRDDRSYSVIVRMRVVLQRAVVGDSNQRFDNLSGSHHQGQVKELFARRMLQVSFMETDESNLP